MVSTGLNGIAFQASDAIYSPHLRPRSGFGPPAVGVAGEITCSMVEGIAGQGQTRGRWKDIRPLLKGTSLAGTGDYPVRASALRTLQNRNTSPVLNLAFVAA